jgi:2-hydroxy-3-keto-5-methylthiopentenyl-1-phosphate phosphatase
VPHRYLFIDFDGTISSEETLSGALRLMNPPDLKATTKRMLAEEITLREGIHELFGKVPSSRFGEIEAYYKSVPLRAGFGELLEYCGTANIRVVIISGGLRQMVEMKLAPFMRHITAIHSVYVDLSAQTMRLVSDFEDDREIMSKTAVMACYTYDKCACIGDGYTDFRMAAQSGLVFARDQLAEYLDSQKRPYHRWNDFFDVLEVLKKEQF